MRWTPERVEEATGLDGAVVESLADAYAEHPPSATMIGIGLQKSVYGADLVRAVSLIPPLLGLHRGFFYSSGQGQYVDHGLISGSALTAKKRKKLSQVGLGRTLERGEIKFLYVNNMNPAVTLPDQGALRRGLEKEDLYLVVHETHWTETAGYADVVLPAPTYLEKDDLVVGYSHTYITKSNRVIEPLRESRDEIQVTTDLARQLGLEEDWLYEDPWNVLGKALEESFVDGTFGDLMDGATLRFKMRPKDEYQTPTGKFEFASQSAKKLGYDPIPLQHPPPGGDGGFVLLTTAIANYTHAQFRDVYGPIEPIVWVNPEDAEAKGIGDGDTVELRNGLGAIKVEARVTEDVTRGVLWSPRLLDGKDGTPQNTIMPGDAQEIGGGPIFHSTTVEMKPCVDA